MLLMSCVFHRIASSMEKKLKHLFVGIISTQINTCNFSILFCCKDIVNIILYIKLTNLRLYKRCVMFI